MLASDTDFAAKLPDSREREREREREIAAAENCTPNCRQTAPPV